MSEICWLYNRNRIVIRRTVCQQKLLVTHSPRFLLLGWCINKPLSVLRPNIIMIMSGYKTKLRAYPAVVANQGGWGGVHFFYFHEIPGDESDPPPSPLAAKNRDREKQSDGRKRRKNRDKQEKKKIILVFDVSSYSFCIFHSLRSTWVVVVLKSVGCSLLGVVVITVLLTA